ncbi:complement factor I [Salminus brasiliensis]|uniref:complement factor I n=1 Tax=Salminus brasiliensis TaxID=930266 RepID=UPI003B82EA49
MITETDSPAVVKPDQDSPAVVKPDQDSHVEPERGPPVIKPTLTDSCAEVQPETGAPDEAGKDSPAEVKPDEGSSAGVKPVKEPVWSNPKTDIQKVRKIIDEQLECGIPNMDYVYRTEEDKQRSRKKRVVGGAESLPTQIQWQVAVQEEGSIHCGGVYLGGCWVLTAAHCVRPKPQNFHIKFSLWKKYSKQTTSDIVPVKNIIIHKEYNSQTYQNDIALVQLEELANEKVCLNPNPAVRSVCVPWSTLQFQPGDTCTISGWGRNKEGRSAEALKWANVTIIGECKKYYKDRLHEGMECAGDLDGRVDSCQGDSGGPLVCKDASGLSYVWGIVSWGEKCGEADYPGVYTKVAHYFEWIRFHTGWPAVTKYNH